MSSPSNAVTWHAAPDPGTAAGWAPSQRATPHVPGLLRLLGAALAVLGGALLVTGTFLPFVQMEFTDREAVDDAVRTLSGWSDEWSGAPSEYALVLGLPLVLAGGALVLAGILAAVSEWLPRARGAAVVVTLAAAAFAIGQVWVAGSYVADLVREAAAFFVPIHGSRGAGYWLLMGGVLCALLAAGCLLLSQHSLRRRPRVGRAAPPPHAAAPAQPWLQPGPQPAPAPWTTGPAPWGGQQ